MPCGNSKLNATPHLLPGDRRKRLSGYSRAHTKFPLGIRRQLHSKRVVLGFIPEDNKYAFALATEPREAVQGPRAGREPGPKGEEAFVQGHFTAKFLVPANLLPPPILLFWREFAQIAGQHGPGANRGGKALFPRQGFRAGATEQHRFSG